MQNEMKSGLYKIGMHEGPLPLITLEIQVHMQYLAWAIRYVHITCFGLSTIKVNISSPTIQHNSAMLGLYLLRFLGAGRG